MVGEDCGFLFFFIFLHASTITVAVRGCTYTCNIIQLPSGIYTRKNHRATYFSIKYLRQNDAIFTNYHLNKIEAFTLKHTTLNIPDIILLEPSLFGDERGFFSETFNAKTYEDTGISGTFVQDNHSLSREPYVIRGLHFQTPPFAQDKLVRVTRGSVLDVVVDIRHGSPTFGQHVSAVLSAENWNQLWVPKGFAHAFCTLKPDTEFLYKVTDYYAPDCDAGLAYDDPALSINWPVPAGHEPILSDKDKKHPKLADLPEYFIYDSETGIKR